ncbi:hypothetical protein LY78DRAFT_659779 [Colletotrichum sublineola]|uniref:Uncharacterized protein n=1 Tax=Colletotrichum sublineola TaxID=1173701 RepID=A0A066WYJ4_COLSU|nr:hypothetical protein LY78DRAFT_659779 [Colletotrichum sublineola]KDN60494.1 hypothetical protein CSUB01_10168 [Colletotrichum sublineola]
MHFSTIFTLIAAAATFTAAAPSHDAKRDDTVCAPGTGFFQSCSNGFRGCCKSDACTIGYCPSAGTETVKRQDPTVCAPGTGFFQSCSNGFRGCCKSDACTLGYCPSTSEKRQDPTVCAPGTGFFQSCANGFRGCCKSDACTIGYCPSAGAETVKRQDPTVCAPGTGFFQSCSNGFRGCCKSDACTIGYCPDVRAFKTVTKAAPTPTLTPEVKPIINNSGNADPTVCAPGTGFFQSCSNGFRGCCKSDACTIGYCPSN